MRSQADRDGRHRFDRTAAMKEDGRANGPPMRYRRKGLCPVLRSLAALTLLMWLSALALCKTHCIFGHPDSAACDSHSAQDSHHEDDDPSTPAESDSSTSDTCLTLANALISSDSLTLPKSASLPLCTVVPMVPAFEMTMIGRAEPAVGRHKRPDWVFTPEVSLGPAHRSHAPPLLA